MIEPGHCGHCREPLSADAVSEYWCSYGCQQLWHMNHSEPLDEYRLYLRWEVPARQAELRTQLLQAQLRAQQATGH